MVQKKRHIKENFSNYSHRYIRRLFHGIRAKGVTIFFARDTGDRIKQTNVMPMKLRWPQVCKLLGFVHYFVTRNNKSKSGEILSIFYHR